MGKIEPNSLLGQEVHLYNRQGKAFPGVILGRNKANQVQGKEDVLLDFGFSSKEEALSEEVSLGDMVTFAPKLLSAKMEKNGSLQIGMDGFLSIKRLICYVKFMKINSASLLIYMLMYGSGASRCQRCSNSSDLVAPDLTIILDTNRAGIIRKMLAMYKENSQRSSIDIL